MARNWRLGDQVGSYLSILCETSRRTGLVWEQGCQKRADGYTNYFTWLPNCSFIPDPLPECETHFSLLFRCFLLDILPSPQISPPTLNLNSFSFQTSSSSWLVFFCEYGCCSKQIPGNHLQLPPRSFSGIYLIMQPAFLISYPFFLFLPDLPVCWNMPRP